MEIASLLKNKEDKSQEDQELMRERAEELHRESIVIDGHIGTLFDVRYRIRDIYEESGEGHVDLPRLRRGGVNAVFLSAFPDERIYPIRGVKQGLEYADTFRSLLEKNDFKMIATAKDIEEAKESDQIGALLAFEGGEFLEGSPAALRVFYRLGLRMLTLTWNDRNLLADGAAVATSRGGLTPLGIDILKEAERLGILIDVSHLSEAGFWDVAEESEMPFVASHANCHALHSHPRNLTDDQLAAIAAKGGVVGISFNPEYLGTGDETSDPSQMRRENSAENISHRDSAGASRTASDGSSETPVGGETQTQAKEPTIERVVAHIFHAIEVAGEDHVAIGTDFDSFSGKGPAPIEDIGKMALLTHELLKRGIRGKAISGILGGNWLRVLRAVLG